MKSSIEVMAEIMPTIRAEVARELVGTHKMNQSEVSRILGVSQPAISQYVRQLRGNNRTVYDGMKTDIKNLCEKLVNGKINGNLEQELSTICKAAVENPQ